MASIDVEIASDSSRGWTFVPFTSGHIYASYESENRSFAMISPFSATMHLSNDHLCLSFLHL
jgi:hypothetical protein